MRFAILFILLGRLAEPGRAAESARPNIVFIIADQWRAQAFGFAGDSNVQTPRLDRFAFPSARYSRPSSSAQGLQAKLR